MRLILKRRYTPRATLGRLYLGQRQLCFVREAPKACFGGAHSCLEEGVYELSPEYTEEAGWMIRVGEQGGIKSLGPDQPPTSRIMAPVTSYRADGTPLFTRLAFQRLLDELGCWWERGEVVELQVVSVGVPYRLESCRIASFY
ncbi:DUF5675 family protein [Algoriphagus sp. AK58]|uniref:DUF5675 family protein n=1 Tax=Algoriphagus sp. AK58 TaxID=1406877 RepID=UPI00164F2835|nr:DUF5675 family protein [Algoriphagus sp. AK58]MBC6365749.1 hypothetical protein [Algoriphagus sp. AK58]